jgi:hypothetical protein
MKEGQIEYGFAPKELTVDDIMNLEDPEDANELEIISNEEMPQENLIGNAIKIAQKWVNKLVDAEKIPQKKAHEIKNMFVDRQEPLKKEFYNAPGIERPMIIARNLKEIIDEVWPVSERS